MIQKSEDMNLSDDEIEFVTKTFQLARDGDSNELLQLLEAGLPPNLRNQNGDTLLMLATYHGRLDAVRVLLEWGADPNTPNDKLQSPLAAAAFIGSEAIVELLLRSGAKTEPSDCMGHSALMLAAMFDRVAVVGQLLRAGADPSYADAQGRTAQDMAIAMGAQNTPGILRGDDPSNSDNLVLNRKTREE